jgi:hypothetical protein
MTDTSAVQIALVRDALRVSAWNTSDRTVLAAAQAAVARGEDLGSWFSSVVTAGAAAVMAAGAGTDLARVDQALDRLDRELQRKLQQTVDRLHDSVAKATDPTTGDVAVAAQLAVDRLAAGVQRVLTGSDALLPEASARAVNQVTSSALAEIHRLLDTDRKQLSSLIAADRERSAVELSQAISQQNGHLAGVVSELRGLLSSATVTAAADRSGPRKGLVYEAAVHAAVHDIAAAAGDGGADGVGSLAGADGSRHGDVLIDLRSLPMRPRLVIEAKDRPQRALSVRQWEVELEQALTARSAAVAIGVCPRDQMPGTGSPVLVLDGRRLVVAWDDDGDEVLRAAYQLARLAAAQHRADAACSAAELEAHVRAIAAGMAPLDEIQRHAAACRKAAEKISATAQDLRTDLGARIEAVQERLAPAA